MLLQTIEKCFSKEVKLLVTNQGTSKDYERTKEGEQAAGSPATPSPFNFTAGRGSVESPQADSPGTQEARATRKPVSVQLQLTKLVKLVKEELFLN